MGRTTGNQKTALGRLQSIPQKPSCWRGAPGPDEYQHMIARIVASRWHNLTTASSSIISTCYCPGAAALSSDPDRRRRLIAPMLRRPEAHTRILKLLLAYALVVRGNTRRRNVPVVSSISKSKLHRLALFRVVRPQRRPNMPQPQPPDSAASLDVVGAQSPKTRGAAALKG
jgi:hypothetical protein